MLNSEMYEIQIDLDCQSIFEELNDHFRPETIGHTIQTTDDLDRYFGNSSLQLTKTSS